jgi:hypothetical protein
LEFARDTRRHDAVLKTDRNKEYLVQRDWRRAGERVGQLAVEASALGGSALGETRDEKVRSLDGILNRPLPVLVG